MNIASIIADRARKLGGKTAILFEDRAWSYAAFDLEAERCASALHGLGIGPGDRVAYLLPKRVEALCLHFGILALGAVALPLNPDYRPEEVAYFLSDSGSRLLITDKRLDINRQTLPLPLAFDSPVDYPQGVTRFEL